MAYPDAIPPEIGLPFAVILWGAVIILACRDRRLK